MPSVESIPHEKAERLTDDRAIELLDSKLPGELDDLYGRTASSPTHETDDGIYLPDPDEYYRQPAPTDEQIRETAHVAVFCGQRSETSYGDFRNMSGTGVLLKATIPYAVSLVFGRAPGHPDTSDPVLGRDQHPVELTQTRIQYYAAGVRHTIYKWGHVGNESTVRANAIQDVSIGNSFSRAVEIQTGPDSTALKGQALVELEIDQWQVFPPDAHTS